ncbi:hypothetical protein CKAN_00257700 [Cinnamomum micranthum f. kanehirae]|uniref:Histone deacetylase complex subunit SAP30 Sin3 binding domain-containing protein n=1 Tax=Cinnamomum micranthum f. kanehirae TaxID=337451 RepID=A0A443N6W8_9MAGN|nr:hypothetical protein CKAN_00257700 [Cinnamomum micranthum f. kanehirae]
MAPPVPIDVMVPERNSQSIGKAPMGHEKDGDAECEDMRWSDSHGAPEFTRKTYIPKHRLHKSIGADQKNISQGIRIRTSSDSQSKGSIPPTRGVTKVNLSKLETASLRRYCRFFNLMDAVSNSSKEHLFDAVQNHFMAQQVEEMDVIFEFARVAKRLKIEQSHCP